MKRKPKYSLFAGDFFRTPHFVKSLLNSFKDSKERGEVVANYPIYEFSTGDLKRAGKMLAQDIPYDADELVEVIRLFKISYNWRNSHAYPMHRVRHELMGNIRKNKKVGITSARMKRMKSIRRKLSGSTTKLHQMQDLCGCRAIMSTLDEMKVLVAMYYNGGTAHSVQWSKDYVEAPKTSGYRGHHLIIEFQAKPHEVQYDKRRVEIQIRTKLQHAWSTAIEAVGMVRKEELKSGEGCPRWLRLFALMSSEFAEEENCPIVPDTPTEARLRRAELIALGKELDAVKFLETLNQAVKYTESYVGKHSNYFLIQYDSVNKDIRVRGYSRVGSAADAYSGEESTRSGVNSVLVEVDKAENLREAYPNYFLDVQMFTDRLKDIVFSNVQTGQNVKRSFDLSWLKHFNK
ncbi:RelA/SpoT domain-containing protein [Pseudochrobactrum sp. Wa41.01b-1]|uniref:RelA/SpoT domain-containing protein n=1 Tax=Pseudochrobactrum sp. Wa41.01b-1 TaxID=2864102 RepID=UPI001C68A739|nr:RelA/SpoT domain-containing protein [Pseudochrobactrum sp. Wa41.01b-1]QYM72883.1 RelA/SpoT domain-containing protein [Pseudochrobactrum sp. Wa41.01b-1]